MRNEERQEILFPEINSRRVGEKVGHVDLFFALLLLLVFVFFVFVLLVVVFFFLLLISFSLLSLSE
jgi:hypothetical protein